MTAITNYLSFDKLPNDNQQSVICGGLNFNFTKFVLDEMRGSDTNVDNVIEVVLGLIGLSIEDLPTGYLDGLDIHNFSAVDALRVALLEGIRDEKLYDIQIDEEGVPFIYSVDNTDIEGLDVWMNIVSYTDKIPAAVIVRGNDPLPYMELRDTINLIDKGEGDEVEVVSLGEFVYEECGGQLYNYYGAISYKDPHFEVTTDSELEHTITLKSYESLLGVVYTFVKPEDVDVSFESTTPIEVYGVFYAEGVQDVEDLNEFLRNHKAPNVGVLVSSSDMQDTEEIDPLEACYTPCVRLEPDFLMPVFSTNYTILGIEQAILKGSKYLGVAYNIDNTNNVCDNSSGYSGGTLSTYTCDDVNVDTSLFKLNIGTDIYYDTESNTGGKSAYSKGLEGKLGSGYLDNIDVGLNGNYVLKVAIPYTTTEYSLHVGDFSFEHVFVNLPNSISTIVLPAELQLLVTVEKPSIRVTKKTLDAVGNVYGEETEDYRKTLDEIASSISLCATPIVNVNLPPPTAYAVNGTVVILDQEECIIDQDPRTIQDTIDTPCEKMNEDINGKSVLDMTLPFLAEDEVEDACGFLYNKASGEYSEGSAVVDGMTVSASDLGKKFKGGVINRISWSYQDSSSFRANVSYGSPITGLSSGNLSMYVQATDSALTREATVVSDKGNGYEYIVSIKDLGMYKAVSMVLADIRVGDTVNVTIYNNIAEARF